MTTARDDILSNLRRSLGVTGTERSRKLAVDDRLERAPKGLIPQRGQVEKAEKLALFKAMAEAVQTSVEIVTGSADVPPAISNYLRSHNLPSAVRMGADLRLAAMPWQATPIEMKAGPSDGNDLNGVSHAFAAVAETGTLALISGPENPTTINFLPDNHIVVVQQKDILGDVEEVMARVRATHGKGEMPRTLNFITGPSRSGDIEQTIFLGAHGPRRLHIVVVAG